MFLRLCAADAERALLLLFPTFRSFSSASLTCAPPPQPPTQANTSLELSPAAVDAVLALANALAPSNMNMTARSATSTHAHLSAAGSPQTQTQLRTPSQWPASLEYPPAPLPPQMLQQQQPTYPLLDWQHSNTTPVMPPPALRAAALAPAPSPTPSVPSLAARQPMLQQFGRRANNSVLLKRASSLDVEREVDVDVDLYASNSSAAHPRGVLRRIGSASNSPALYGRLEATSTFSASGEPRSFLRV